MSVIGYQLSLYFFIVWLHSLHFIKVYGRENLPKKGPFILAPNHMSIGDPPVIGVSCYPLTMHFMAKRDLFSNRRWGWWFRLTDCIPISRDKNDFRATKMVLNFLKEGKRIVVFPEGTRSRTGELTEPELGVGFLAMKSGVPVIPVLITGTEKALPVEGRYKAGVPVKVYIGKAVNFDGAENFKDKREKYRFASNKIMKAIAGLKKSKVS